MKLYPAMLINLILNICLRRIFTCRAVIALNAAALLSLVCVPQAEAELSVKVLREGATYAVGETVEFVLERSHSSTIAPGTEISWVISRDRAEKLQSGVIQLDAEGKAVLEGTLDVPGFLLCEVAYRSGESDVRKAAAAAVAPLDIAPSMPVPDDFASFWDEQKRELAEIPINLRMTEVHDLSTQSYQVFDVQADSVDGVPVSGYLVRPRGAEAGSLPALLTVQGAGVRSSSPSAHWANRGFLSLNINAHGIPNGMPDTFYKELASSELSGYRHAGRSSREESYFRGMFLRVIRALDVLTAQPEWDGRTLVVYGSSQGGAQAIVAAGLDERVTFIAAGVAAMCDHTAMMAQRAVGWPRWVHYTPESGPDPDMLEASRYYDMVNFAKQATIPGVFTVGFIDRTCAPTSVYAMYNAWQGEKQMFDDVVTGHSNSPEASRFMRDAVIDHATAQRLTHTDSKPNP